MDLGSSEFQLGSLVFPRRYLAFTWPQIQGRRSTYYKWANLGSGLKFLDPRSNTCRIEL